MALFLPYTLVGKSVRALIQDRQASRMMGINVERVYLVTLGLGRALAGVAACLLTPICTPSPGLGDNFILPAFAVPVLTVKLRSMALSAALTALGGGLFAMLIRQVDPPTLFSHQDVGVMFALLALVGGMGTIWGRVVLGVLLILAARFMKVGLVGTFKEVRARLSRR